MWWRPWRNFYLIFALPMPYVTRSYPSVMNTSKDKNWRCRSWSVHQERWKIGAERCASSIFKNCACSWWTKPMWWSVYRASHKYALTLSRTPWAKIAKHCCFQRPIPMRWVSTIIFDFLSNDFDVFSLPLLQVMDFAKRVIENPGKLAAECFARWESKQGQQTHEYEYLALLLSIVFVLLLVIFRLKREEQSLSNIRTYQHLSLLMTLIDPFSIVSTQANSTFDVWTTKTNTLLWKRSIHRSLLVKRWSSAVRNVLLMLSPYAWAVINIVWNYSRLN